MTVNRLRSVTNSIVLIFLLGYIPGCEIFDYLAGRPEFSLSGSRVALMPIAGPENWWYGENPTANHLYVRIASLLREGGAQLVTSRKIFAELQNYVGDSDPPWINYGKRLRAEYVIVSHLLSWALDTRKSVGFTPGRASMDIQVYDVEKGKLVLEKHISATIGIDPDAGQIFTEPDRAKQALIRAILKQWRSLFVGKSEFS